MLQDGKMSGRGLFKYTNGDVYEGEFRNDLKEGVGRLRYHSGAVFEGEYVQDRRSGRGMYVYSTGDVYDGDWKDGVMVCPLLASVALIGGTSCEIYAIE